VRICRAAFGALALRVLGAFHAAMTADRPKGAPRGGERAEARPQRRNPRRLREIILAAFLTAAAIGFIAAALLRGESGALRSPSMEAERRPFTGPQR
jgi:hypothetical protein